LVWERVTADSVSSLTTDAASTFAPFGFFTERRPRRKVLTVTVGARG
jgi:hypothetical protein